MSEVLQANIFFFITGVAIIVFTALLCVGLYHLIGILKSIRRIVDRIEAGSEIISDDMMNLRKYFAETSLVSYLMGIFFGKSKSKDRTEARAKKRTERRRSSKSELTINGEE